MKVCYYTLLGILFSFLSSVSIAQTSYTWTGSSSSNNWNDSLNWQPKGIPGNIDNAVIDGQNNILILDQDRKINNITLKNVYLDLRGYTLSASGNTTINTVQTSSGSLSFSGNINLNQLGTKANVYATCFSITIKNCAFNSTVYLERTGNNINDSWQSNIFKGTTTIVQNSAQSTWYLGIANEIGDGFMGDAFFQVKQGGLFISYKSQSFFKGNINLSNAGDGITLGDSTIAPINNIIASGKSITTTGFNSGTLYINKITQQGTASNNIQVTGTANLIIEESDFGGDVTISTAANDTTKVGISIDHTMFRQSTFITTSLANLKFNHFNISNSSGSQTQILQSAQRNKGLLQSINMINGTLITQ